MIVNRYKSHVRFSTVDDSRPPPSDVAEGYRYNSTFCLLIARYTAYTYPCTHLAILAYRSSNVQAAMVSLEKVQSNKVASGTVTKYSFPSTSLGGLTTSFNIFLPSSASSSTKVPFLTYLAGLTCTEDTGAQKGGFFNTAAEHGIAIVFPDTSPRGAGAPDEDKDWDFGTGAGFYVDATAKGFEKYQMYTFLTDELPKVLKEADLGLVRPWSVCRGTSVRQGQINGHAMRPS